LRKAEEIEEIENSIFYRTDPEKFLEMKLEERLPYVTKGYITHPQIAS
jgi:hypothetical protein